MFSRLYQHRLGTCKFRRGDYSKSQRRNLYLPEPGQTCYQGSTITQRTTCFCQCISENGNTGSLRLHSYYLDWSQRCTPCEKNQDTELIDHAQLNADIRRLYKLKDSFAESAKQYFFLPLENIMSRTSRNRQ
jgi:hypothetical protein